MGSNSSAANQKIEPNFQQEIETAVKQTIQSIKRQQGKIEMEENMIKMEMKKYTNEPDILRIYATSLVASRKQRAKMEVQVAQLQSMNSMVKSALVNNKVAKIYADLGPMFTEINNKLQGAEYRDAIRMFAMGNEQLA